MARFVLVHGAFGGAWSWEPRRRGARARTATRRSRSTCRGPARTRPRWRRSRSTPTASGSARCWRRRRGPSILVGHSMGGVAITHGAARCPQNVSLLVYVAAFMPRDGQSLLDLTRLPEGAGDAGPGQHHGRGRPAGRASSPSGAYADGLMCCCTPEQIEWAVARRRPQPVAPFATPVTIRAGALDDVPPRLRLSPRRTARSGRRSSGG